MTLIDLRSPGLFILYATLAIGCAHTQTGPHDHEGHESAVDSTDGSLDSKVITNAHQLIFEGARSGEAYFHPSGTKVVLQAELSPDNPFYQIYTFDLNTGAKERISTGDGKTTCSYFHPNGETLLFSSTHLDPETSSLQQAELDFRKSGKKRRYSWDYDASFDIFSRAKPGAPLTRLTTEVGYDAEGAFSPKGDRIVFASNRSAYQSKLSPEEAQRLEDDPSYFIDIYTMNIDGSDVRQLTTSQGYDGGPFYDATGDHITWRRFTPDGSKAEIWIMKSDGTEQRQVTSTGVMSWAPFFHPSGDYIIYTSNTFGYDNFELFIVATDGKSDPVRVTLAEGFDGLPVFSPDGTRLVWSSTRTHTKKAHVYLADWNHDAARALLGLDSDETRPTATSPLSTEASTLKEHVEVLASPEFEGRLTGSEGEIKATAYVADFFAERGILPAGDDGTYYESFEFSSGVSLGTTNTLVTERDGAKVSKALEQDFAPLAFSKVGRFESAPVVFAGYGISAPKGPDGQESYTSYDSADIKGKWVLLFRGLPSDLSQKDRAHIGQFSGLRYKAIVAHERGAKGLLVMASPTVPVRHDVIPLSQARSYGASPLPILSLSTALGLELLGTDQEGLDQLASRIESSRKQSPTELNHRLQASIELDYGKGVGRNILGRLQVGDEPTERVVMVGAHIDHLGVGEGGNSLASGDAKETTHFGADDNASGVAAMMEIAAEIQRAIRAGTLTLKHDIVFGGWSGEELGILGSNHHVDARLPHPHASLADQLIAYLNMDMIGRFRGKVVLQGIGSSKDWLPMIEVANRSTELPVLIQPDTYLPTDATTFYLKKVPILNAFTGAHSEYHTPKDTPDKLNYPELAKITQLMKQLVIATASRDEAPGYIAHKRKSSGRTMGTMKVYLGTIPDYASQGVTGVKFSGATPGSPAEKAGIVAGDIMIRLGVKEIGNIYDFVYMLGILKPGEEVDLVVVRDGKEVILKVTPALKD